MILLTTSHRPTGRMRTLCHDFARSVPSLTRVNRGKMGLHRVAEKAAEAGADGVVMIDRWKGGVGKIRFFKLGEKGLTHVPPLIHVQGLKLCREFNVWKRHASAFAVDGGDGETEGMQRLRRSLSDFFGATIVDASETPSEHRTVMRFSPEGSSLVRISFYTMPENVEIGPCITVSQVAWET